MKESLIMVMVAMLMAGALTVPIVHGAELFAPYSGIQAVSLSSPATQNAGARFPYQKLVEAAARKYDLPVPYILAVIRGESYFDPNALSHKGAIGLMQVMPSTAAQYGVSAAQLWDPARNIDTGVRYLAELNAELQDPYLALGAYYCGPGGVDQLSSELRADCRDYVHYIYTHLRKVLTTMEPAELISDPMSTAAAVRIALQVIQADNRGVAEEESELTDTYPQLKTSLNFNRFSLIHQQTIWLEPAEIFYLPLTRGNTLKLALQGQKNNMVRVKIEIVDESRELLNTMLESEDGAESLIGGPANAAGMVLIRIKTYNGIEE